MCKQIIYIYNIIRYCCTIISTNVFDLKLECADII